MNISENQQDLKIMFDSDASPEFLVENLINEETGTSKKQYKIKGVFTTIGETNRNGRTYPSAIWESEVSRYQGNFSSGSIDTLMEYNHPPRTEVDPMEAVAKITSLSIKDKYVMGEAVLLDNPKANQLKSLIDNGIKISVSSRGVGSVRNGIVENFKLVTYDIVPVPSDYNATMNGVYEGFSLNEGILEDLSFSINESGKITPLAKKYEAKVLSGAITDRFKDILNTF